MIDKEKIKEETKSFFDKYGNMLPETIYYKDWKSVIMSPNWQVLENVKKIKDSSPGKISVAEIGVGMGATTYNIAKILDKDDKIYLFDFNESVQQIKEMLCREGYKNIYGFGCSYKKLDSYCWNLLYLLKESEHELFDYVFIDGAHNFPTDGLAFFLIDMLTKKNGFVEFDDYHWTIEGHIKANKLKYNLNNDDSFNSFMRRSLESFTDEQLSTKQVALIVDIILKKTHRYREIMPQRLYQKIR